MKTSYMWVHQSMNLLIKGLNEFSLPGAATRHLNPGELSRSSRSYVRMSLAKEVCTSTHTLLLITIFVNLRLSLVSN